MRNAVDDDDELDSLNEPEESSNVVMRFLPALVVVTVVGGFIALAWYAYHAGTQSLKDDDLLLVEADKTPVKEKPDDPGGMKFPHQEKTVFETFGGGARPPRVERLMPPPEEPVVSSGRDTAQTWVNEKLQKPEREAQGARSEHVIGDVAPVPGDAQAEKPHDAEKAPQDARPAAEDKPSPPKETPAAQQPAAPDAGPAAGGGIADNHAAPVEISESKVAGSDDKKLENNAKAAKNSATSSVHKTAVTPAGKPGGRVVQLGAYRSEQEAQAGWKKIQARFSGVLGGEYSIVRADLGAKGVFYRLRADVSDARAACAALSAKGQACMPVK